METTEIVGVIQGLGFRGYFMIMEKKMETTGIIGVTLG